MTAYWFRPKRYGWGATPNAWQGWALTAAAVLVMVAVSLFMRLNFRSFWALAALLAFDAVTLGVLTIIIRSKTDGEWRWRWGD
jgi:uncharacterized membrane protein HdeD (DUF308 family)